MFLDDSNLEKITFKGKVPKIENRTFLGIHPNAIFHVPSKYKSAYKKALTKKKGFLKTMQMK